MVRSGGGCCENVAFVCVCLGDMEEEVRLVGLVLCVCERILVLESLSVNLNVFKTDRQRLQYITTQSCSLYLSLSSQNTEILKKKAEVRREKVKPLQSVSKLFGHVKLNVLSADSKVSQNRITQSDVCVYVMFYMLTLIL